MNKGYFFSCCLTALTGYGLASFSNHYSSAQADEQHDQLQEKINKLALENKTLLQKNATLAEQLKSHTTYPTTQSYAHSISPTPVEESAILATHLAEDSKKNDELHKKSGDFMEWLNKRQQESPWFDFGFEMKSRFENEDADYAWAKQQEDKFYNVFTQDPSLAGLALKAAACKSTQCQLKISVGDQTSANETIMAVSRALSSENIQVIADTHLKNGEAVLYVPRPDHAFEFK